MNKRFFSNICFSIVLLICIEMASINADDNNEEMSNKGKSGVGLTNVAANLLDESESVLVEPLFRFSGDLFRKIKKDKENVIFSPLSVHSALNLVLLGAGSNSGTETELLDVLGYSHDPGTKYVHHESYAKLLAILREITAIGLTKQPKQGEQSRRRQHSSDQPPVLDFWTMGIVRDGIPLMPRYLEQVKKYYNTSIKQIPASKSPETQKLADDINKWAKDAGFQSEVIKLSELNDISFMLLSAVRVQAYWFEEFYEHKVNELFYNYGLRDQLIKNSTGMTVGDVTGRYFEFTRDEKSKYHELNDRIKSKNPDMYQKLADHEFRVVEIPLIGNLTFTIFEPIMNGAGGELAKLVEQLLAVDSNDKQSKLRIVLKMLDEQETKQHIELLQMPKFKFESDISLKSPLKSLGLKRMFDPKTAELQKVSTVRQFVSDAKHQAVIEVDKSGIKAAAVTKIHMVALSLLIHRNPIKVHIQNPFLFVLRYSKVPLFIGQLVHL